MKKLVYFYLRSGRGTSRGSNAFDVFEKQAIEKAKVPQEYVRGQRAPETYLEKYFGQLDDVNKAEHVQGKIGGPWGRFAP